MRYRHVWPGLLLLAALTVLLAGLVGWGDHFLSPGPTGGLSRLLQLWPASRGAQEPPPPLPRVLSTSSPPSEPAQPPAPATDRADETAPTGQDASRAALPSTAPEATKGDPAVPGSRESATAAPAHSAAPATRYALALGTFPIAEDAERIEARLNQAGFSTVRFRQQAPARVFSVVIPQVRNIEEAQAIVERLRQEGFTEAVVLVARDALAVRVAQSLPLRTAVKTAEQLRAAGHDANVTGEASRAGQVTLRHGNFATRQEAEVASREIAGLGVPNEVIQIR